MDYRETLNLPKTDFPMKANLTEREPEIQKRWAELDLYHKLLRSRRGASKYVLHDGPPYADGGVHVGTALNKILKDFVVKFKTMHGFEVPFIPGWDCHGLPIEHKVVSGLGEKARTMNRSEIRRLCQEEAKKSIEIQGRQFRKLGVFGDWENPYLTLDPAYEAAVIDLFADLVERGFIYRKRKPIHWCMSCQTALAEAELEYAETSGPSIYVHFPADGPLDDVFGKAAAAPASFLVWTTTPWTLPANVGIALHPEYEYTLVEFAEPGSGQRRASVVAEGLREKLAQLLGWSDPRVVGKARGSALDGRRYRHPFARRQGTLVLASWVRLQDGTGCVHTAPGHGEEDYQTGIQYKLEVLSPVDEKGHFTEEAGEFAGQHVFDADPRICERLQTLGCLAKHEEARHSYPHCWRCKKPVIFRATEQWFVAVDHNGARQSALQEVARVQWVPGWGQTRISGMLRDRPDWCLSRQRAWGIPIPAFYCVGCAEPLLEKRVLQAVRNLFSEQGSSSWYTTDAEDILPKNTRCKKCNGAEFRQEQDIFDVWFESGASHRAVVMTRKELQFPADLYLEGTDQHRGWFQLSLLPCVMTQGTAPFRTVLTHGFVVDQTGDKVSKSKSSGALWDSEELVKRYGADVVRLWIASIDFTGDILISEGILADAGETYTKVRNTLRFLLGNLSDFDPGRDALEENKLWEIDRWMLQKTRELIDQVTRSFENFEFFRAFQSIRNFCVVDLSSFYLDVLKDRLYTFGRTSQDRRSAQTALCQILVDLVKLLGPILPHTAEEAWSFVPGKKEVPSVHLASWPRADTGPIDLSLWERWKRLIEIRSDVNRELERLRAAKKIGKALEAEVTLASANAELGELVRSSRSDLEMILMVSKLSVAAEAPGGAVPGHAVKELQISVTRSEHKKCERCWNLRESVGKNAKHPALCERCVAVLKEKK